MNRNHDDRATEALLAAIIDWATGDPLHDGLGYGPSYVEGLRRRYNERMAELGRGKSGGGDGSKSRLPTPTAHPPVA